MKTIVLVVMLVLWLVDHADAGRGGSRGRGSGYSSRSHSAASGTGASSSSHRVRGYTRKNGSYVAPHHKTDPDRTQRNNYSTKGNVNPYTGKAGTKRATR